MSETMANDVQRYISLVHEIVIDQVTDIQHAPITELLDFWVTWTYWELQLYSGIQMGIEATWERIQTQAAILQPSVLNTYTAFRCRAGLGHKEWVALIQLLAASGSLRPGSGPMSMNQVIKAVNKDTWARSLDSTELEQILLANGWMVPILLFKMGPRPIVVEKKRRS